MPDACLLPISSGPSNQAALLSPTAASRTPQSHGGSITRANYTSTDFASADCALPYHLTTNDVLAANLASTSPITPQKALANSAKKRRHLPSLSRASVSPSYGAKVSMIFQNAALALHPAASPPPSVSPNTGKSRVPLAQARNIRFGHSNNGDARAAYSYRSPSRLPDRSNRCRPPAAVVTEHDRDGPESVSQPNRTASHTRADHLKLQHVREVTPGALPSPSPRYSPPSRVSSTEASKNDSERSTDSARVTCPVSHAEVEEVQRHGIDAWLDNLLKATNDPQPPPQQPICNESKTNTPSPSIAFGDRATSSPPLKSNAQDEQSSPLRRSPSNKENVSPTDSPSPIRPPLTHLNVSTPSRFRNPSIQMKSTSLRLGPGTPAHFPHPTSPRGHLSVPAPRKRARHLEQHGKTYSQDAQACNQCSAPRISIHEDEDEGQVSKPATSPNHNPLPHRTHNNPIGQDFTVNEDALVSALAKLSPSVEIQRKAHRPKRERCFSYWDEDVLDPESPAHPAKLLRNGKRVLEPCAESEALTKDEAFVEEAEGAEFKFRA